MFLSSGRSSKNDSNNVAMEKKENSIVNPNDDENTSVVTPLETNTSVDINNLSFDEEDNEDNYIEKIDSLLNSDMKILTADGEFLHRPKEQQAIMALYDNGIFLVSKSHMSDPYVLKLESYAKLRDVQIEKKIPVSLEVIRTAYRKYRSNQNTDASGKSTDTNLTEMQNDIISLIRKAVSDDASDIHVVNSDVSTIVEMRRNGVLKQSLEWQPAYGEKFCSACFAMADASDSNYNPTEYQAARISSSTVDLPAEVQALRLQFNPLAYGGRYMIMRLLYKGSAHGDNIDIASLGYHKYQIELLHKMSQRPVGICVISGPTGSGKSTTLFKMLSKVMEECNYEKNVLTIEDPPERPIAGAKQMPVTNASTPEERAIKFIQAISAAMRSDPDTIMIGEVRDSSSAGLAIEAAMTGHQVWTTVHANDALMILSRLRNIGVAEYNLYTPGIIFGLVAQRLTRKLCPNCRIPYNEALAKGLVNAKLAERIKESLNEEQIAKLYMAGPGCNKCGDGKGYIGRTVCAEIIYPDDTFMNLMMKNDLLEAKKYWMTELKGMTMLEHGLIKAINGEIPPTEIERVVGVIELNKNINLEDYEK